MKKSKLTARDSLRVSVICAFLSALSIVLGKYLAINIGEVLRISFENMPIIFAGIAFGSICGMATAVVADLVGCMLVGYAINPIVTLGAAVIGAAAGIYRLLPKMSGGVSRFVRVAVSVFFSHFLGSILIKTAGLAAFYEMPYIILLLWRALNYLMVGVLECAIIFLLLKNNRIRLEIKKINGGRSV